MDSVKPHDSGCYSDPGQHPTSAISLTTCNSSQICRVTNPASTTPVSPSTASATSRLCDQITDLTEPSNTSNPKRPYNWGNNLIHERPATKQQHHSGRGTQQATKSMNRDTLSRRSASSPAIPDRAISNIDNVEDRFSRTVFEDASPAKLEKPASAPFLSPQPLSRCPERRRRYLPATSPSLYSRSQPRSLNPYRILTSSPSEPLYPLSTPTVQP